MTNKMQEFDLPFDGTTIHCWRGGHGHPLVLLHGSGAGVSTFSNFKSVIHPLAQYFDVLASDIVGFGRSGRRPRKPYFDMDMWVGQTKFLIDQFGDRKVGLVGHSLAGSFVLKAASGGCSPMDAKGSGGMSIARCSTKRLPTKTRSTLG